MALPTISPTDALGGQPIVSNKKFYRTKGDINGLHSSVTSRVRGGFSSVMTLSSILIENNNMPTPFESAARLLSCTRIYKRNVRNVCFESIYGIILAGIYWFSRCWRENPHSPCRFFRGWS